LYAVLFEIAVPVLTVIIDYSISLVQAANTSIVNRLQEATIMYNNAHLETLRTVPVCTTVLYFFGYYLFLRTVFPLFRSGAHIKRSIDVDDGSAPDNRQSDPETHFAADTAKTCSF
jgi:hypothetical protein